jgi:hypothetical protein
VRRRLVDVELPPNSPTNTPGKSSLLLRFTDDDFLSEEETSATVGVDFKVKSIELNGRRYKLSIWVSGVGAATPRGLTPRTRLGRSASGPSRRATTAVPRALY